jgi:hypothetical protein
MQQQIHIVKMETKTGAADVENLLPRRLSRSSLLASGGGHRDVQLQQRQPTKS